MVARECSDPILNPFLMRICVVIELLVVACVLPHCHVAPPSAKQFHSLIGPIELRSNHTSFYLSLSAIPLQKSINDLKQLNPRVLAFVAVAGSAVSFTVRGLKRNKRLNTLLNMPPLAGDALISSS